MRLGDPMDELHALESEDDKWLRRRPVCSICGEHIQDERAFHVGDDWYCDDCIRENKEWID